MKFWKGALALATVTIIAACGAADDDGAGVRQSTRFEGYVLPGTAVDAKAMGFTDCKVDYYAAVCRKPEAVLLGAVHRTDPDIR